MTTQSTCAHYLAKFVVRWCYCTWDTFLSTFFKLSYMMWVNFSPQKHYGAFSGA